ncbi:glycosyltransferase [Arthrobacter sp. YD2]|uniref:glycosyltransferase n=1 Tax=Arthrobacter sp. YD2 TaxID=3058046 RepID=UPI0025B359E6|nr:glycosyltransferase [Arthrobacter sp. YD2]MDN3904200.1 glycosyltransferase [Arthrobacter sp. YD2]
MTHHADEQQAFSPAEHARRQRYAADIDALIADYERVLAQSKRDAGELLSLGSEFHDVRLELEQVRAELQASKVEAQRLRKTLTALRASSTLRAGKAITLPVRSVRKAVQQMKQMGGTALLAGRVPALETPSPTEEQGTRRELRALQRTYVERANAEPSIRNVLQAVSHGYYVLGDLEEPARLVRRHLSGVETLTGSDKRTVEAVLGMARIADRLPPLGPRQPNPGYLTERGRILYCAHSTGHFNSNGYSTRTAELSLGLRQGGMDVLVAARPGYPWDAATDAPAPATERLVQTIRGVKHVFNPGPSWTDQALDHYWTEATDIYVREAQQARVQAIHAASNHVTALPALAAARRLGLPFSYEVRGLWEVTEASGKPGWEESERYRLAEKLESHVARAADTVFAITEQVKDELVRRGVHPDRIHLLPNGVDTDSFTPMPPSERVRTKLQLPADIPVVGYAGSLVHYEGVADLLRSFAILKEQGVGFRAVIVGDGAELSNLQREAEILRIDDLVEFTGRVSAQEVAEYISVFDVMPCPRRRMAVTELVSPLKPLEAMAAGKPMVLTDLGPLRTFAGESQERALLAEPSNPQSLAQNLRILLEDPERRLEMGRRARLWVLRHRSWSTLAGRTAKELSASFAAAKAAAPAGTSLQQVTAGLIADTFTTEGLRPEVLVNELHPDTWRTQMQEHPIDVLFVESAWEGRDGEWRQKVGFYDDERFGPLRELVDYCGQNAIPTIFWNKEDPVHFNRFRRTAAIFDHVFTTDANCLRDYGADTETQTKTIASLPFYAQPKLHNPLPADRPYSHTVAYAGSYYGDRYPKRSQELAGLLEAARPHGLTIFDRQHLNPESPYRFPGSLRPFVQGGLPYLEMVDAYKSHPVHINVNSVDASPTMFSRRVVELAASGTAVMSGKGQGVERVLAGLVHTVSERNETSALLERWMTDERARLEDVWLAYRLIHRGHTAAHRLAYAFRCAGLIITAPEPSAYAVRIRTARAELLRSLEAQTVRPAVVVIGDGSSDADTTLPCLPAGDATQAALSALGVTWTAELPDRAVDRTFFEDLLTAESFGEWSEIAVCTEIAGLHPGTGLASLGRPGGESVRLARLQPEATDRPAMYFHRPGSVSAPAAPNPVAGPAAPAKTILVAGHDLKFAGGIVEELKKAGHTVMIDQWLDHNRHNEEQSRIMLAAADIIFCEWTLGNAAWYSQNVGPHQRLVTRMHSQELFTRYPQALAISNVQSVIFVGRHVADRAIRDQGIPSDKAIVIPNPVDTAGLELTKPDDARHRLGLVGIVPAQKHLDRALDVLALLRKQDRRYELHIKGKRPQDYPWMANRPEEMAFYQKQEERIASDPNLQGAVHFDGHGNDMAGWYRKVGVVLSVSDFESFHLTLADGGASGCVAVSLPWAGADQIYPPDWIQPGIGDMADYILDVTSSDDRWRTAGDAAKSFVQEQFDQEKIIPRILATILGYETA